MKELTFLGNFEKKTDFQLVSVFRHESIRQNIGRIINIWEERNVFDASTIKEFRSILGKFYLYTLRFYSNEIVFLEASKSADGTPAATVAESRSSSHSNNNNESIMSDFSVSRTMSFKIFTRKEPFF